MRFKFCFTWWKDAGVFALALGPYAFSNICYRKALSVNLQVVFAPDIFLTNALIVVCKSWLISVSSKILRNASWAGMFFSSLQKDLTFPLQTNENV